MKKRIAVVGATGLVGRKTIEMLKEYKLDDNDIFLFASKNSVGKDFDINSKKVIVQELNNDIQKYKLDYALFCTPESVSKIYAKVLASQGTIVIDFSSLYRTDYPIIIPEINMSMAKGNIVCNPNCSTSISLMALANVHKLFGLKKVEYSTYQSLSGAGQMALLDQKEKDCNKLKKLDFVIDNNLIPYIGTFDESGFSKEENKMIYETKKILNDKNIQVSATCIRVNVDVCHSISINFETRKNATKKDIINSLKNAINVEYVGDDFSKLQPSFVKDKKDVYVGRVRKTELGKNTFAMFVVGDNLRKGASQNGVQILAELIKRSDL